MFGRSSRSAGGGRAAPRRDVATFAISGFGALIVLGIAGALLVARTGTNEAIRTARQLARFTGDGIVQPSLRPAILRDDPAAIAQVDRIVRRRVLRDPVVRVKIWTAAGHIIYSDEPALIGTTFRLGQGETTALRTGRTFAEISDLTAPENRFERSYGKLLEVYFPISGPGGTRLLFETYQRVSAISSSSRRLLVALAPALGGALVLLWVIQLPLAGRLARRLREGQQEREALLRRAIQSSELERRRIARDLHDGAVQNLSGIAWSLSAAAAGSPAELTGVLQESADETRRTIKELRSLLVEIYPPDLHRTGIHAALGDLIAGFTNRGIAATLDLPPALALAPEAEALVYRVTQEALRNVLAHSRARHVNVQVRADRGRATVEVIDDGRGFIPEQAVERSHFGLRLLADLAHDAGGYLNVLSAPGAGTTVRLAVPLR